MAEPPQPSPAGFAAGGREVEVYTLASPGGLSLDVMTYGGVVLALRAPDRHGDVADVALGYDTPAAYLDNPAYFGAVVGRYANRIAGARCTVDGRPVRLDANDGPHHLHGGHRGFDAVVWGAAPFVRDGARGVVLTYESPDGEGGYPGALAVRVTYTVTDADEWVVDYHATGTRPTPVNLTQHTYLNLAGGGSALGHRLASPAGRYVPVGADGIPTGPPRPVDGTPFDFRSGRALGEHLGDAALAATGGYDHTLVLPDGEAASGAEAGGEWAANEEAASGGLREAARLEDPGSGRALTLRTTEPGFQLYTANHVGGIRGKGGGAYRAHDGVALETQHFPDSPNRPGFPDTVLRPGQTYTSRTVYAFSVA